MTDPTRDASEVPTFSDPVFNQIVEAQRAYDVQREAVNLARGALGDAVNLRDQAETLIEYLKSEVEREEAKLRDLKGQVTTW